MTAMSQSALQKPPSSCWGGCAIIHSIRTTQSSSSDSYRRPKPLQTAMECHKSRYGLISLLFCNPETSIINTQTYLCGFQSLKSPFYSYWYVVNYLLATHGPNEVIAKARHDNVSCTQLLRATLIWYAQTFSDKSLSGGIVHDEATLKGILIKVLPKSIRLPMHHHWASNKASPVNKLARYADSLRTIRDGISQNACCHCEK